MVENNNYFSEREGRLCDKRVERPTTTTAAYNTKGQQTVYPATQVETGQQQ